MGSMPVAEFDSPRLMTEIIDEKAEWIGDHTFMRYPAPNWEVDGYRTMTWRQYADAINKIAYWLDERLGTSQDNDTIAYLGPQDARYVFILPAVIKTNRKVSGSLLLKTHSWTVQ
jgi:acyl-CoA synthetase (AMP-forming)/AMP-acid ligase II